MTRIHDAERRVGVGAAAKLLFRAAEGDGRSVVAEGHDVD